MYMYYEHVCRHKLLDADIKGMEGVVAEGQFASAEKK